MDIKMIATDIRRNVAAHRQDHFRLYGTSFESLPEIAVHFSIPVFDIAALGDDWSDVELMRGCLDKRSKIRKGRDA